MSKPAYCIDVVVELEKGIKCRKRERGRENYARSREKVRMKEKKRGERGEEAFLLGSEGEERGWSESDRHCWCCSCVVCCVTTSTTRRRRRG